MERENRWTESVKESLRNIAYPQGITMSWMANDLGIGEATLRRRLRDEGMAFIDLLKMERIVRISRMIADNPDVSLDEICDQCGFDTGANLSRAYRRETGRTIGEFREKCRAFDNG